MDFTPYRLVSPKKTVKIQNQTHENLQHGFVHFEACQNRDFELSELPSI